MNIEEPIHSTASAAEEMAALLRAHHSGKQIEYNDILKTLGKMLAGEANTASEALALVVAAQSLMAKPVSEVPPLEISQDGMAIHCIYELIKKAVGALEIVTGETAAHHMGLVPVRQN